MVIALEKKMVGTLVSARIIYYVSLISFVCFVLSEYVKCLLIFVLGDGYSMFSFMIRVPLLLTCVDAMIISNVSFISLWRFVVSESVILQLQFGL